MRTITVTLPDGTTATRTTKRDYTHVVAALKQNGEWCALAWAGSLPNAQKALKAAAPCLAFARVEIVAVNP